MAWKPDPDKVRTANCLIPSCKNTHTAPVKELFGWKCADHTTPTKFKVGDKIKWNGKKFAIQRIEDNQVVIKPGSFFKAIPISELP